MNSRLAILVFFVAIAIPCTAQDTKDVVAPGDNLVVKGIPPIPTSLAEDVDRYGNFRSATITSWHPVKREMLIGTRFADTVQVHLVQAPGAERKQITFFRDAARGASFPPSSGDYFIFTKDRGGDEFYQFYRYDLATGTVTLLTDGKSRNTGAVWSSAGDRIAYGSTRRNGADVDLYSVGPSDPKSDRMIAKLTGGGWEALDWSPDDRTVLLLEDISANESYLWLCDAASGEMTSITLRPPGGKKLPIVAASSAKTAVASIPSPTRIPNSGVSRTLNSQPSSTPTSPKKFRGTWTSSGCRKTARNSPSKPMKTESACCT